MVLIKFGAEAGSAVPQSIASKIKDSLNLLALPFKGQGIL